MASEFIKRYAVEWAAYWNHNYKAAGGTDPKRFFRDEHCVYRTRWHGDGLQRDRQGLGNKE
jgi:hypothetical protein